MYACVSINNNKTNMKIITRNYSVLCIYIHKKNEFLIFSLLFFSTETNQVSVSLTKAKAVTATKTNPTKLKETIEPKFSQNLKCFCFPCTL